MALSSRIERSGRVVSSVPEEVAVLVRGRPEIGAREQAFPFLSVDADGFPHSALLSRAELEPTPDGAALLAVIASTRTRANVVRTGTAALLATAGSVCHHLKLELVAAVTEKDLLGGVFITTGHKRDDIGVPMLPLSFRPTSELAEVEDWRRGAAMFARLRKEALR
ncbi:hypothetical protein SAMN05421776_105324 [Nocardia farcinica]|uniref:Uncharacterized protein n=1 Tax=Nocardia farcinica TaxID=37329 RepID=A0A0H5NEY6_NOCFR|nr:MULTISPECIES: hypothetical protein [Nocardia]AXK88882.1 hypothetical protein DXT66_27535 [Nocardia farcinica]MBF6185648.1 hypothetical protein [Nocardia farcinica]MBF6311493.1 hypothetical protein [Nocardia farcinica]MBF6360207.1 hypothetical protein [Nocardia farcinica]MBF6408477.1 hypothetical protein [Nocardia farcinica]